MTKTGIYLTALVFVALALSGLGLGQSVGSLRQQVTDLPQSEADREVLNHFFGSISAVQGTCAPALVENLRAENALAACSSFSSMASLGAEFTRQLVEMEFMLPLDLDGRGKWLTPWRENPDFGTVRELEYGGSHYFLAIDHAAGKAYAIKFLD